jgi:hypothetical protein
LIQINAGDCRQDIMQGREKLKEGSMALLSFTGALARIRTGLTKLFARPGKLVTTENDSSDAERWEVPSHCYDASLLFRRMALLRIDAEEFAREEPLLMRELQARCALCRSKEVCLEDLIDEESSSEFEDWREYCPNEAVLNAVGALQNCPRAAQYLKVPYAYS